MCINPTSIKVKKYDPVLKRVVEDWTLVPCGKCIECQKDRQNEIAVMCHRTALQYGSMHFVTLTYSNDTIPFYFRVYDENGELKGEPQRLPENIEKEVRTAYFEGHNDTHNSMEYVITDEEGSFDIQVAPSLCREDARLWIKRGRVQYKRHYKEALPDFKYIVIGEYGPRTGRPHFHLAFFGLTTEQVDFICEDWKKKFGYVLNKEVVRFTSGHKEADGFEACAKYIGKYMSKGKFEDEKVISGCVEKPRKCASIYFGYGNDADTLMSYHLCYDMYGNYDPDDISSIYHAVGKENINTLLEEIIKRKKYQLNGKYYKLPRSISRNIFYRRYRETTPFGEVKIVEKATCLQRMVSQFIRDNLNKDFDEQLRQLRSEYNDEVPFEVMRQVVHSIFNPDPNRAKVAEKAIIRQYQKSVF